MKLPWVSRERFDEQRAEIERLRTELKQVAEAKEKLWNVMLWRMGGVIVDVEALPNVYQPKPAPENKGEIAKPATATMPRDVRTTLAKFEVKREGELMTKIGRPHPERVEPERAAVLSELNQAANEVTKAS